MRSWSLVLMAHLSPAPGPRPLAPLVSSGVNPRERYGRRAYVSIRWYEHRLVPRAGDRQPYGRIHPISPAIPRVANDVGVAIRQQQERQTTVAATRAYRPPGADDFRALTEIQVGRRYTLWLETTCSN